MVGRALGGIHDYPRNPETFMTKLKFVWWLLAVHIVSFPDPG